MEKVEICPCCGQKIVIYRHKLNKVLLSALFKLYGNDGRGRADELGLTNSQFANMQKLRYFDLVDKEGRVYILNQLGLDFLMGRVKVPSAVYTRNNIVVDQDEPIYVNQIKDYAQVKEDWEQQASLYDDVY